MLLNGCSASRSTSPSRVEIDEAVPLADFEILIAVGAPLVLGAPGRAGVLEEPDDVASIPGRTDRGRRRRRCRRTAAAARRGRRGTAARTAGRSRRATANGATTRVERRGGDCDAAPSGQARPASRQAATQLPERRNAGDHFRARRCPCPSGSCRAGSPSRPCASCDVDDDERRRAVAGRHGVAGVRGIRHVVHLVVVRDERRRAVRREHDLMRLLEAVVLDARRPPSSCSSSRIDDLVRALDRHPDERARPA